MGMMQCGKPVRNEAFSTRLAGFTRDAKKGLPGPLEFPGKESGSSTMVRQVQDAFIVAATRTPIGRAPKGMFRNTRPDDLLVTAIRSVMSRARASIRKRSRMRSSVAQCPKPNRD